MATSFKSRVGPDTHADLERLVDIVNGDRSPENVQDLEAYLDVDSIASYMAVSALIGNSDGIDNNYVLVRTRERPRFATVAWDLDFTFRGGSAAEFGDQFARNALMRRMHGGDARYRQACDAAIVRTRAAVGENQLSEYLRQLANTIRQAHMSDPVLGRHPESFDDQVEAIGSVIDTTFSAPPPSDETTAPGR